ncbi:hypothetical protein [Paenibacillus kandeliae]|uniref:hypothetical protein n=1 Tax=Paenibacillus kandeliae TaxID=3231269 RepID=UPI00345A10C4
MIVARSGGNGIVPGGAFADRLFTTLVIIRKKPVCNSEARTIHSRSDVAAEHPLSLHPNSRQYFNR